MPSAEANGQNFLGDQGLNWGDPQIYKAHSKNIFLPDTSSSARHKQNNAPANGSTKIRRSPRWRAAAAGDLVCAGVAQPHNQRDLAMQSPTPSAAVARETASALEALLEIKHSPPSVLGTRTCAPANQPTTPTAPLGVKGSGNPNLQIPVTMPIAIAAQAHVHAHDAPGVHVHVATTASEGASIGQSTGGGTLPRHMLTPRHQQPHEMSFLPAGTHDAAPHSTMYPPPSPVVLGTTEIAPASAKMKVGVKKSLPGGSTSATGTAPSTVREDEIQAALTSKPQRGRKRMNLTAEERKELTKTRNREHARTTR